jgi:HK97 family phage prohead protease
MSEMRRKVVAGTLTKGPTDGTFWLKASDGSVDRDGDTINPAGWDVSAFLRNPVILWAHDHSIPAIAKALQAKVIDDALWLLIQFPPKGIHPLADTVHGLVAEGFIPSNSVGFRPIKFMRNEQRGGVDFIEQELIEDSIVNVPANPNALLQGRSLAADVAAVTKWLGARDPVVLYVRDDDATEKTLRISPEFRAQLDAERLRRTVGDPLHDLAARGHHVSGDRFDVDPEAVRTALQVVMRDAIKEAIVEQTKLALALARGRVDGF